MITQIFHSYFSQLLTPPLFCCLFVCGILSHSLSLTHPLFLTLSLFLSPSLPHSSTSPFFLLSITYITHLEIPTMSAIADWNGEFHPKALCCIIQWCYKVHAIRIVTRASVNKKGRKYRYASGTANTINNYNIWYYSLTNKHWNTYPFITRHKCVNTYLLCHIFIQAYIITS